jgi:hypothetical protein
MQPQVTESNEPPGPSCLGFLIRRFRVQIPGGALERRKRPDQDPFPDLRPLPPVRRARCVRERARNVRSSTVVNGRQRSDRRPPRRLREQLERLGDGAIALWSGVLVPERHLRGGPSNTGHHLLVDAPAAAAMVPALAMTTWL